MQKEWFLFILMEKKIVSSSIYIYKGKDSLMLWRKGLYISKSEIFLERFSLYNIQHMMDKRSERVPRGCGRLETACDKIKTAGSCDHAAFDN